jgi:hypothetical protein
MNYDTNYRQRTEYENLCPYVGLSMMLKTRLLILVCEDFRFRRSQKKSVNTICKPGPRTDDTPVRGTGNDAYNVESYEAGSR